MCAAAAHPRRRGHLVGLDSACVDLLAVVSAYPKEDAKIRSESFEVQGGCVSLLSVAVESRKADA